MSNNSELLRSYLIRLGLEPRVADMYHALQAYGSQTISELARSSGIERIQIYRLLDDAKASGLVDVEIRYKRSILHAAPISKIQVLLSKREQELKDLQQDYTTLVSSMNTQFMQASSTRVQFYEGIDGIKQMLWNQTKTKTETLSILHDNMQRGTNLVFFERWVRKCNEQNVHSRGIIGDHFIQTQKTWYATHSNERLKNWQSRYIADKDFPIQYSMTIYDDVVMHYNWNGDKVFGIEVKNSVIGRMQRQFFEMLWKQAIPVNDLVGPDAADHESSN